MSFVRQHKGAVVWSVTMHIAVVAAVVIGVPWRVERPPVPQLAAAPIQGVIIDQAAIERERKAREDAARAEQQRRQREERQRQEAINQQRQAEQREQQRVAAEQRARDEAQRKEQERVAAERAERAEQQRREEQAKAEREAQARREREEADRRARELAEQRRRQQAEAELQAQIAAEAEANAARAAGLLDQYMLMIENHVKRFWQRPLSARPGLVCVVDVVQAPTGDVLSARVSTARCNGDEAVRRSVEDAVQRASPLPRPPSQAVFSRSFTLTFAPDE